MPRFPLRRHPHLYQINTYAWLERLSSKLGRTIHLADVPDSEWDAIAAMGFDIVWLMGVWLRSPISIRLDQENQSHRAAYNEALPGWKPDDIIGSAYSVKAYEPDPQIGSWNDIDAARNALHKRKTALFLDFVGNHTALDHPWTHDHPEFYVQGSQQDFEKDRSSFYKVDSIKGPVYIALGRDPYFPAWSDVGGWATQSERITFIHTGSSPRLSVHARGCRTFLVFKTCEFWSAFSRVRPILPLSNRRSFPPARFPISSSSYPSTRGWACIAPPRSASRTGSCSISSLSDSRPILSSPD